MLLGRCPFVAGFLHVFSTATISGDTLVRLASPKRARSALTISGKRESEQRQESRVGGVVAGDDDSSVILRSRGHGWVRDGGARALAHRKEEGS